MPGGWWALKSKWRARWWQGPAEGSSVAGPPGTVRVVELAGEERASISVGGRVVEVVVHGIELAALHPGKVWINYRDHAGEPGAVLVDSRALIALRPAPPS